MTIEFIQDWNGTDAVVLENEILRAVILPRLGGKTASLVLKENGFELAAPNTRGTYRHPERQSAFADFDASGLDDAFPTVDSSALFAEEGYHYTDHGEIWRSAFNASVVNGKLQMQYASAENPYVYTKTVSLADNRMLLEYEITNTGTADFPCIWTWHGLVRYEEGMRLLYPAGAYDILNVSRHEVLGAAKSIHSLQSDVYDFSTVPAGPDTSAEYFLQGRIDEGRCGYVYPSSGTACVISYDCTVFPYLCFWVTAGGFRGDYNCAFEPTNGFYDGIDIAQANNCLPILRPGETLAFTLALSLTCGLE